MFENLYTNNFQRKPMEDPFYTYSPPPRRPPPQQPRPRRVVSIPVRHVDTEKKQSESAVKIQKIFRGFRVRKTVKKILELNREVDDVERRLMEGDTMEIVRRNKLEKLKVNEALMAVLFKLDSVRGFDFGVRELRKMVITKAIMLQEIVDAAIDDDKLGNSGGIGVNVDELAENFDDSSRISEMIDGETLGEGVEVVDDSSRISEKNCGETLGEGVEVKEMEDFDDSRRNSEKIDGETLGDLSRNWEKIGGETLGEDVEAKEMEICDDSSKMQVENSKEIDYVKTCNELGTETLTEDVEVNEMQVENSKEKKDLADDNGESWECVGDETNEHKSDFVEKSSNGGVEDWEARRNSGEKDWYIVKDNGCCRGCGGEKNEKKDKLLEELAEDNKRLIAMVSDLCQKNAIQASAMVSLSQRVEQLEKDMNDRMRKKKKKCNASLN